MATKGKRPVALVILDGWGLNPQCEQNAVCQAQTPRLDELFATYPHTRIGASGMDVGLPDGQMGNSEVGHLNIGAGRIVYQDLTRISKSIADGDFFTNPVLTGALGKIRENGSKLHLMGLLSDGGVHSHNTHLYALLELAKQEGLADVCVHAFLDGRDTPPRSGIDYLAQLEDEIARIGCGRVATITGRYYAMDRDTRWDRVERAYRAMTEGVGEAAADSRAAILSAYAAEQGDEFVAPRVIEPAVTVDDGDGIIFFNFRSDRARELTRAFTETDFDGFTRRKHPKLCAYVCMTEYDATFDLPIAFGPEALTGLLGEVVSGADLKQLRIAETEKYAHVTFFFNGGSEEPFPGEDRCLIPSPRDVATYDQKPAMSAVEVTDEVEKRVASGEYALIVLNYANCDMVGHTGVLDAAVAAMETVDACVGRVADAVLAQGGALLITADHGNCEQMSDGSGGAHTAHTSNPVPLVLVDPDCRGGKLNPGILADLAPTVLDLMGLDAPREMTGKSLLVCG
ncbi:2,3-bisphosphoglycerate-independent phosphoglycerate mutase [Geoalkalibacter halelectricus]|uniref:2,3-bisphosphoglycerate-independent phosphoglycerate mutase n=1 Tax=Geoalkalibacter halelectricus TaxID=2847045 RepID=A0ABY5ZS84_9BACT|nr:2,3-bisphosphoglycerate-independent phosphoglycerate mutase [Geoalkalibacter halelectricus]MDO3378596.1 2,3-bisphosphoglycerate-independent phosphoglycerate mutase [Geoalkalibacter halelectricus]UWZ80091.1 2,3-bisphosphoglycerate-independent phosphoglycerate mutase [Geoalkalibacter halelectricus]